MHRVAIQYIIRLKDGILLVIYVEILDTKYRNVILNTKLTNIIYVIKCSLTHASHV